MERVRTCLENEAWGEWGECQTKLECQICTAGDLEYEPCADCSARSRACGADSLWGPWSDCEPRVLMETCDGLDNDCDGETDEQDVCGEPCGLVPISEAEPILGQFEAFLSDGEGYAFFYWDDSSMETLDTLLFTRFDRYGEVIGAGIPIEFTGAEPLSDCTYVNGTNRSNVLWSGDGYVFFTAVYVGGPLACTDDPAHPDRVAAEIWMTKISREGTVLQASLAFELPIVSDSSHWYSVTRIMAAYSEDRREFYVMFNGDTCTTTEGCQPACLGAATDATGQLLGSVQEYPIQANMRYAASTSGGFVAVGTGYYPSDPIVRLLFTNERAELSGDIREVSVAEYFTNGSEDAYVLSVNVDKVDLLVNAADPHDLNAGVMLTVDPAGQVEHLVEIPGPQWILSPLFADGSLAYLVEIVTDERQSLQFLRLDREGQRLGDPIEVGRFGYSDTRFFRLYHGLAVTPYGYGVLAEVDFPKRFGTRSYKSWVLHVVAPADCAATCQTHAWCTPGESQTRPCGIDIGECRMGNETRTCLEHCTWSIWSDCQDAVWPVEESGEACHDTLDNDCDSLVDGDDSNSCTICEMQPDYWLCSYCETVNPSAWACQCIYAPTLTFPPCECILSGSEECNCTIHPQVDFCLAF